MNQYITQLATEKWIEDKIYAYSKSDFDTDLADLSQDIYLQLLEDEKLDDLTLDELKAYIVQTIKFSLFSKTSKFFYKYKKPNKNLVDIDTIYDRENASEDEEN